MTFVGHMLTGAGIGALVLPRRFSRRQLAVGLGVFAVLAFAPDIALPWWGHHRYFISHSIFVNGAMVLAAAMIVGLWAHLRRTVGGWGVIAGGMAAWLSHLLLDSFYNHGQGIMIGWPWSRFRLNFSMPWFHTFYPGPRFSHLNLRVMAVEACFYLPLFLGCLWIRGRTGPRRGGSHVSSASAGEQVGGGSDGQIHPTADRHRQDDP